MFKSINEPQKQGNVMPFCLNGLQATALCSQIIELANRLAPGRNQIPLAYKTVYLYTGGYRFTPQATWSTRTVSTDAGVSGLNGKHLLWRPAFLWYKLLTPRHVYARRSSLWCANAGKARACTRWDQKGDSYRGPTLQTTLHLFINAILAARRMRALLQTRQRCNGAGKTSQRSVKNTDASSIVEGFYRQKRTTARLPAAGWSCERQTANRTMFALHLLESIAGFGFCI